MSKRDVVIFFAGAEAFHTLSHIILPFFIQLPINVGNIEITSSWNNWAIAINLIVTAALLWWAKKLPK